MTGKLQPGNGRLPLPSVYILLEISIIISLRYRCGFLSKYFIGFHRHQQVIAKSIGHWHWTLALDIGAPMIGTPRSILQVHFVTGKRFLTMTSLE